MKAQLWLLQYSEYQIKNVTYDVIESEVPANQEAKLSFAIIKDSRTGGTGVASIWISELWQSARLPAHVCHRGNSLIDPLHGRRAA